MADKLTSQFNNKAVLAQLGNSVIAAPSLQITANKHRFDYFDSQEAKDKKLRDFIDLVDATHAYIEQLKQDIDELEAGFTARNGDEWREKLALKIIDPDGIPQRREDQTIEDYRKELEPILINKMLNADGSIKASYESNPELSDYAQWAQKKHHYNIAVGYVRELEDPKTAPERIDEIESVLKYSANIETLVLAERGAAAESDVLNSLKSISDNIEDRDLTQDQNSGTSAFLKI